MNTMLNTLNLEGFVGRTTAVFFNSMLIYFCAILSFGASAD